MLLRPAHASFRFPDAACALSCRLSWHFPAFLALWVTMLVLCGMFVACAPCALCGRSPSAMHYAAQRGHNKTVEVLLELGADALAG